MSKGNDIYKRSYENSTDLTLDQHGPKLQGIRSRDLISKETGDSTSIIQRFLRLNELIRPL